MTYRTALASVLFLGLMFPCFGQEPAFVDEFDDSEGWYANNPRTPPEFSVEGGVLTLIDPPGGEVTWGTSIYRNLEAVDFDANPYLVVHIVDLSAGFRVTLINDKTKEKIGGLCAANKPGIVLMNIPEQLGWSGTVGLHLGLYASGTESYVKISSVKITGTLDEDEQAAYERSRRSIPAPHFGLDGLQARRGWCPHLMVGDAPASERLFFARPGVAPPEGATFISERTVFLDPATLNYVWKVTDDPSVDLLQYYDIDVWNADGSAMFLVSQRLGGSSYWLMDADGERARVFRAPGDASLLSPFWSVKDRNVIYGVRRDDEHTCLIERHLDTGEDKVLVTADRRDLSFYPPHPSEEYFLLARRSQKDPEDNVYYLASRDGTLERLPLEGWIHRLRFTKRDDLMIFFNRDDPRTQHVVLPDGSQLTDLPASGGHPDWTPDGSELTFYEGGKIWAVKPGGEPRVVMNLSAGGHGGSCLDGEWFVSDVPRGGPYANSILRLRLDGSEICHRLSLHGSAFMSHANIWHPHHHSTHPHPNPSPDGTKVAFDSDSLGDYTELYVAVARYPDPPRDLEVEAEGNAAALTWREPEQCRELRGYLVWRSPESGIGYTQITPQPLTEATFTDADTAGVAHYVVTAVEHSGLQSRPSNEVCSSASWPAGIRHCYEPEAGEMTLPIREFIEQATCSNGYYVARWEDREGEGACKLKLQVPREGEYLLWGRTRGEGAWRVAVGHLSDEMRCDGRGWQWQKVSQVVHLEAGEQTLTLTTKDARAHLDKVLLTDDPDFNPTGMMRPDEEAPAAPAQSRAEALSPFTVHLNWPASDDPTVSYHNVYQGATPDFECEHVALIASPAGTETLAWGLLNPGTACHFAVTAVDGHFNESEPARVAVDLPAFEPHTISLEAESGELAGMLQVAEQDDASEGKCAAMPAEGDGRGSVKLTFTLPVAGEYAVWARTMRRAEKVGRCTVMVDDRRVRWAVNTRPGRWGWDPVGEMPSGNPRTFELAAGEHTLTVESAPDGKRFDKFMITDDPREPADGRGDA